MAAAKKREEKLMAKLREASKLKENKKCADCIEK